MTSSTDPGFMDRPLGRKTPPTAYIVIGAVVLALIILIVAAVTSCSSKTEKVSVVPAAPAASAPVVAASQILPLPGTPVPGVIEKEKESVVGGACLSAEEVKKAVREACEPKKPVVAHTKRPKHHVRHLAVVPPPSFTPPPMRTLPPIARVPEEPNVKLGTIWLWHDPYATAAAPKPCVIASGDGRGLPPYCSGFNVKPPLFGETKPQWLVRVGGGVRPTDTGLYTKE